VGTPTGLDLRGARRQGALAPQLVAARHQKPQVPFLRSVFRAVCRCSGGCNTLLYAAIASVTTPPQNAEKTRFFFKPTDRRTAATDSKLCKVKTDYYMALFFTEEDVMGKIQAYSRAVIARCFSTSTQSLTHRIFPAEFMTRLEYASVLRLVHTGGHIMKPTSKHTTKRQTS